MAAIAARPICLTYTQRLTANPGGVCHSEFLVSIWIVPSTGGRGPTLRLLSYRD